MDGKAKLTFLCTLLSILNPSATAVVVNPDISTKAVPYAVALQQRVMDIYLNNITGASIATDAMYDFLVAFFKQYFTSLEETGTWLDSIRTEASQELQDLMAEYQTSTVDETVNAMQDVLTIAVTFMTGQINLPFAARLSSWSKANPKLSKAITRGVTMAMYGFAIFGCINAFQNWDGLSDKDKVPHSVSQLLSYH
jgi:hypothetical protein